MSEHRTHAEAWHRLQEFLALGYADGELRDLAGRVFNDPRIAASMPGEGASAQGLAREIVLSLQRWFAAPPERTWDCLEHTRPFRAAEIHALRGAFVGDPAAVAEASARPPAPDAPGVPVTGGVCDECDLVALLGVARSQRGSGVPACLDALVVGTVNGMPRALTLAWTARRLTIEATPSLCRGRERLMNRVELELPVEDVRWQYYPHGRHFFRDGRPPPVVELRVEAWGDALRRVALGDADGASWFSVDFVLR